MSFSGFLYFLSLGISEALTCSLLHEMPKNYVLHFPSLNIFDRIKTINAFGIIPERLNFLYSLVPGQQSIAPRSGDQEPANVQ